MPSVASSASPSPVSKLGKPQPSRGMKESEMKVIADLVALVLSNPADAATLEKAKAGALALSARFPLPY